MPAPRNPDDAAPEAQALAALAAEARALSLQIGVTGVDAAARLGAGARLAEFVAAGRHGEMAWMARRMAERADPRALWPAARSVVMVAENYGPAADPLAALERPERAAISAYAQSADYHDVLKKKLKRLGRALIDAAARAGAPGAEIKVFVDTAPVMEKPLAEAAGLGWRGKHTNLVARGRGSWLFLGAIFTTLALPETAPETDHCGACRRCLDICPTDAFPAPYQLDARRCLSYLTIELKGPIPRAFRRAMGNRIYGCDDCLAVCPWNKFAEHAAERAYWARAELKSPRLTELAALSDADFRAIFSGSPIKRIGRGRFVRNVMIALGNLASGPPAEAAAARAAARARLDDADPLVRGAAAWALSRLDPEAFAAEGAARAAREPDAAARAEWTAPPE